MPSTLPPSLPTPLPAPDVSPRGASFTAPIIVTVQTDAPGAWVAHTLDGSEPDCANPQGRISSLSIAESATLRARTCANDAAPSQDVRERYAFALPPPPPPMRVAAPVYSPAPGKFSGPISISITSATPGATVFYSFTGKPRCDGSDPAALVPIRVSETITIRAIACMEGMEPSSVVNGNYQISKKKHD